MKKIFAALMLVLVLAMTGCATKTGSAAAGAVGGAAAGGGTYEYRLREEMKRIEEEYKAGRMSQEEYNVRKDQIERLSVLR